MSVDIRLLQCVRDRDSFNKLAGAIPSESLEPDTRVLLDDVRQYYLKFPDHADIDKDTFLSVMLKFKHKSYDKTKRQLYSYLVDKMMEDAPPGVKDHMLGELHELACMTSIGNLYNDWSNGDSPGAPDVVGQIFSSYMMNVNTEHNAWIQDDIGTILEEVQDDSGFRWRLQCLNRHMRGLRPGDMGVVAARPDQGKTTFFASEVTFMARQLPEDKNVIWLNNEGMGKRIVPRIWQAALGLTLKEISELHRSGELKKKYIEAVGREDRIRVFDIHNMTAGQVERILKSSSPGIAVGDMLDHIKYAGVDTRTDLMLEEKYKWWRDCCVRYEFAGFASSQISADGEGMRFPPLDALKDSKTGKQGACDFQLMIGTSSATPSYRFLSLPKNKLRREGSSSTCQEQVKFNPEIARYEDLESDGSLTEE